MMYERLTQKTEIPYEELIRSWIGKEASERIDRFESKLSCRYDLKKLLQFPFGKPYGWCWRYCHKSKPLCYLFFEKGAFTVTISLSDGVFAGKEKLIEGMLPKTKDLWEKRYPCGKCGGWLHYRVLSDEELQDVIDLVEIRCAVKKKLLNN